jgi:hypothetical protein
VASTVAIQVPSNDGTGNFRTACRFSHFLSDDPIVFPGQPGASHNHTFFGNMSFNASTTTSSTGNSTCDGGTANRSSYWVPTVRNAAGVAQVPSLNLVYYKSGYQGVDDEKGSIVLPVGLKLITSTYAWTCAQSGVGNVSAQSSTIPTSCPTAANLLHVVVSFPQCWDGVSLDSPDHRSHARFGTYGIGCPASHPVPLPAIQFTIDWPITSPLVGWSLSSDPAGGPGGATMHADIWTGWDPAVSDLWLTNCTRRNADCFVSIVAPGLRLA